MFWMFCKNVLYSQLVQCQGLKPVLSHCSQTADQFWDCWWFYCPLQCTLAHTSSIPMGAINFYMQEHFFTLTDTIPPIFTVITEVWPYANRAVVTNNLTVIIKAMLIQGFLYMNCSPENWHFRSLQSLLLPHSFQPTCIGLSSLWRGNMCVYPIISEYL